MVLGLVWGRKARTASGGVPVHRSVCAALLLPASLQCRGPAALVVEPDSPEHSRSHPDLDRHQYRDVAGAHLDRLGNAVARLSAQRLAHLSSHQLGLVAAVRVVGRVRIPVHDLRAHPAGPPGPRAAQIVDRGEKRMNRFLLAEYESAQAVKKAAERALDLGRPALDALTPNPIEEMADLLSPTKAAAPIGWVMFIAGATGASIGYLMQWFSAVIDYPIISGGRPLNSWPAF